MDTSHTNTLLLLLISYSFLGFIWVLLIWIWIISKENQNFMLICSINLLLLYVNLAKHLLNIPLFKKQDQLIRPIQSGIGSQSGLVKTPKIGENRSKIRLNREFWKKKSLALSSVFKTMEYTHINENHTWRKSKEVEYIKPLEMFGSKLFWSYLPLNPIYYSISKTTFE